MVRHPSEGKQVTNVQERNEAASIEAFVKRVTRAARKRSTDAGTTCVIMATARAAADMAPRKADGSIDETIAREMLTRAARSLR